MEKNKIPEELAKDDAVKKAVEKLDVMYLDKEEREMYENELKRLRDYIAEMKTAEIRGMERGIEKGIEKGMEKGEKQGIELTKKVFKLSNKGYTKSQIAKECDIPESKVEKILE